LRLDTTLAVVLSVTTFPENEIMTEVVFLTGASSGLGAGLARRLADDGAHVVLTARRQPLLDTLAREIRGAGGTASVMVLDVRDRDAVHRAIEQVNESIGPIDLLIANAGVGDELPVTDFCAERFRWIIDTNLMGPVHCIEAVLPSMLARRRGHIVGIGSLAGYCGVPGASGYSASKAGLAVTLESLRVELQNYAVQVSTICPGFIKTPMTDANDYEMPFILSLDDGVQRIHRAIRKQRREYAFPWPLAFLARMSRYLPNWLYDRLLRKRRVQKTDPPR